MRVGQAMHRPAESELRSYRLRSPDLQSEGTKIRTFSPLRRFGQGPSYSPNRLVSQNAMHYGRSVQGCLRANHKTYGPLDDQWVILSSSEEFNYFRTLTRCNSVGLWPSLFCRLDHHRRPGDRFPSTQYHKISTEVRTKRRRSDSVLWQNPPTPTEMSKGQSDNTNNATKMFD